MSSMPSPPTCLFQIRMIPCLLPEHVATPVLSSLTLQPPLPSRSTMDPTVSGKLAKLGPPAPLYAIPSVRASALVIKSIYPARATPRQPWLASRLSVASRQAPEQPASPTGPAPASLAWRGSPRTRITKWIPTPHLALPLIVSPLFTLAAVLSWCRSGPSV